MIIHSSIIENDAVPRKGTKPHTLTISVRGVTLLVVTRRNASTRCRRNPKDLSIPQIGEELAAARALHDLAQYLEDDARSMIESYDPKFAGR